jgi:hypothetical protein
MLHAVYGPLFGPWRATYEQIYRALLPDAPHFSHTDDPAQRQARIAVFDALRFGRLCQVLRQRSPDERISAGMLVFEVSAAELERALRGPMPEASSHYQVPGTERLPQSQVQFLK